MRRPDRDGGFTLIETLIVCVIVVVLMMFIVETQAGMRDVNVTGKSTTSLHASSYRALRMIMSDLQMTAVLTMGGKNFPYVYDGGVTDPSFAAHSHPPAQSNAMAGDSDFGAHRDIVFLLPADANDDGVPDLSGHQIVWSTDEFGYRVETRDDRNVLVRTVNGGSPTTIAPHVERIVFDTPASSGFTIPLNTVRVRLFLRLRDQKGHWVRHETETIVRLQPTAS